MTDPVTITEGDGAPYLAVDIVPDDTADTFTVDESELDGPELLGWQSGAGDWDNIVCDVTSVHISRGVTRLQGALTRAEAGECLIRLRDTERRFDPMVNADVIHTSTPLRVRAWGFDLLGDPWDQVLFTGSVDSLGLSYPHDDVPQVTISGVDLIADLANWSSTGRAEPGVGAGDDLLERVGRVLEEMGLPPDYVDADSDTAYAATLNPTTLSDPWQNITDAEDAELGRVWVNASNRLVVRARESLLSGPVRGTLSDVHGETDAGPHCCYTEPAVALGPETLTNRAIGSRRGLVGETPATVQLDDPVSQARYGTHVTRNEALELQTDAQVTPWAESLIVQDGKPELRVDSVMPVPSDLDTALDAWPAVCATDLGDRWYFRYQPATGPQVARTIGILGTVVTVTPDDGWQVTWLTTEAPTPGENPTGWFALDVSDLDSGDLLAPFGGVVGALPA